MGSSRGHHAAVREAAPADREWLPFGTIIGIRRPVGRCLSSVLRLARNLRALPDAENPSPNGDGFRAVDEAEMRNRYRWIFSDRILIMTRGGE